MLSFPKASELSWPHNQSERSQNEVSTDHSLGIATAKMHHRGETFPWTLLLLQTFYPAVCSHCCSTPLTFGIQTATWMAPWSLYLLSYNWSVPLWSLQCWVIPDLKGNLFWMLMVAAMQSVLCYFSSKMPTTAKHSNMLNASTVLLERTPGCGQRITPTPCLLTWTLCHCMHRPCSPQVASEFSLSRRTGRKVAPAATGV